MPTLSCGMLPSSSMEYSFPIIHPEGWNCTLLIGFGKTLCMQMTFQLKISSEFPKLPAIMVQVHKSALVFVYVDVSVNALENAP